MTADDIDDCPFGDVTEPLPKPKPIGGLCPNCSSSEVHWSYNIWENEEQLSAQHGPLRECWDCCWEWREPPKGS